MEKTYDQVRFVDVLKKRFSEARTAAGRTGRLKLVESKNQRSQLDNSMPLDKQSRVSPRSDDAIIVRRFSSGQIIFWNRGAQKLYGWSKKNAMGKPVYKLLDTELPEPPREIKAKLRRHGCWSGELLQTTRDGKSIAVASYWSLRQGPNSGPLEILEVNYPARQGKHFGPKSRESDRLARAETMAAVFAHEVANPLSGLSASLQFAESDLAKRVFDVPSLRATVQSASKEVERLVSLVNEFRSLALPQPLDLKAINLPTLVEEILASQKIAYRDASITVKTCFEDDLPCLKIDAAKMKQAVLNLCKNATEAMSQGGCLLIKLSRSEGMVVLEISDNGIGLSHDVDIFDSFKTTKPNGSGLGLPIAQQIVSAHNGTINYTTKTGHGTTFKVCLPAPRHVM